MPVVLEGKSFMDLIASSAKEDGGPTCSCLDKYDLSGRGGNRTRKQTVIDLVSLYFILFWPC
jgi:hypothetical protein